MLTHQVAIVTGGTRGIGLAIVRAFIDNGAHVTLFGSREETVARALQTLREEGREAWGLWPDLSDARAVENAVCAVHERCGRLDILVNNAGMADSTPIAGYTAAQFDRIMALNVNAVMYAIIPAVRIMKEQGSGVILNTSSMVSLCGQPSGVAYPTSKSAINGLTVSLARELGPWGIRVNAVAPGIINTDMVSSLPKEMIEPLTARIPLRRIGTPEDVANAFLFLAGNMASYVTGEVLSVDGAMRS